MVKYTKDFMMGLPQKIFQVFYKIVQKLISPIIKPIKNTID